MRSWALLAVAVLAAALGLGTTTVGPSAGWLGDGRHGRLGPTSLTAASPAPFEAIVPADASRVLVGRLGNPLETPRAGLLVALLSTALLLLAARPAFAPARVRPGLSWLSPGRRSVALRAPPRSRLV